MEDFLSFLPHQQRSRMFRYFDIGLKDFFSSSFSISSCSAVVSLQGDGFFLPSCHLFFFFFWIFRDRICQGLRRNDSLTEVLVSLPISIHAEEAKPSLGAFPYFIRLDTNMCRFTAWFVSSKVSRFVPSFWQWKAGRMAFSWTYITNPLHLRLLYTEMENWPQTSKRFTPWLNAPYSLCIWSGASLLLYVLHLFKLRA